MTAVAYGVGHLVVLAVGVAAVWPVVRAVEWVALLVAERLWGPR